MESEMETEPVWEQMSELPSGQAREQAMAMQLERAMVQEKEQELAALSELATALDSALVWAHLSERVMALEWELESAMA